MAVVGKNGPQSHEMALKPLLLKVFVEYPISKACIHGNLGVLQHSTGANRIKYTRRCSDLSMAKYPLISG